jgi:hypothetical protein
MVGTLCITATGGCATGAESLTPAPVPSTAAVGTLAESPLDPETFLAHLPVYRLNMKWSYVYQNRDITGAPQPSKTMTVEVVELTSATATLRTSILDEEPWNETVSLAQADSGSGLGPSPTLKFLSVEDVTVPAGTFKAALRVRMPGTGEHWYAKGVGLVKTASVMGFKGTTYETTKVLTAFSTGP